MTSPIVFLDTETDGVHPDRKVWEVGMIRRESDGTQRETSFFVEIDLATADPFGLKVGRFYERHPLGRQVSGWYMNDSPTSDAWADQDYRERYEVRSPEQAAMLVARWTYGAHIVGAVPNFDTEVLSRLLRENRLTPAWHHHLIDIEALAVGALATTGRPVALPWKSDDLTRALGVEPASELERHTALGDTRWAMRVYDAVMGGRFAREHKAAVLAGGEGS